MRRFFFSALLAIASAHAGTSVPVLFVANQGQAPKGVRFTANGSDVSAWFLRREIVLRAHGSRVRVQFEGALPEPRMEGSQPLDTRANFLIGDVRRWRRGLAAFGAVRYFDLYAGIDLIYAAKGPRLKSEFVVAPGADPAGIRIRYSGAGRPAILPNGDLSIPMGRENLIEGAPHIYQERDGSSVMVEGWYALAADGAVGFAIGPYDRTRPLIIDPVLSFSTVIGNTGFTAATAIAVDSAGAVYIAGYTDSTTLPTANPAQNFNRGSVNVFVAKLNPSGNGAAYCTYLGGSGDDRAYGIAVDADGAAYVTGTTTSADFPTLHPVQSTLNGSRNAFVFRLNPLGDMLDFSTYLGGNGADTANGIALDGSGNAYIVGDTTSSNFPAHGFQSSYGGSQDAFVAKLSSDGSSLLFATYLGGTKNDHGAAIAVDASGSTYVTGSTWSSDFPVANAYQAYNHGFSDAFVARLSSDGTRLVFSTYLGGAGGQMGYPEAGLGIALDRAGGAYVAGVTSSSDFPVSNALQPQLLGFTDSFVAKLNPAGGLLFSTYMGGTGVDMANTIAVDASGAAYVAGYTYSTDFPVTSDALQPALGGYCDGFLFKLSPVGDALLYATYLGGAGADTAAAIALDSAANVYLAGWTQSPNFPVAH